MGREGGGRREGRGREGGRGEGCWGKGETHLRVLVREVVQEGGEELVHTINSVTVFPQDPDHGGPVEEREEGG